MITFKAPQGTTSMQWNGIDISVKKNGIFQAPDEAMGDLLEHGCTLAQDSIEVKTENKE